MECSHASICEIICALFWFFFKLRKKSNKSPKWHMTINEIALEISQVIIQVVSVFKEVKSGLLYLFKKG